MSTKTDPETWKDMTVERGHILIGCANYANGIEDLAIKTLLVRYMDCIIKEQEHITAEVLGESTPKATVH